MKIFILLFNTLICFSANAQKSLNQHLKSVDDSVPTEVIEVMFEAADSVALLDATQMHALAELSADYGQWHHAGFYYVAAHMRALIDARVYDLKAPEAIKAALAGKVSKDELKQLRFAVIKDPVYQATMGDMRLRDLQQRNQQIKLHLFKHLDVLRVVVKWYSMWHPQFGNDYVPTQPSVVRLNPREAEQAFQTYNRAYLKSNQDILMLMAVPEYQQHTINKQLAYMQCTADLFKYGKYKKDPKMSMKFKLLDKGIKRIELEKQLFPQIDWSWF